MLQKLWRDQISTLFWVSPNSTGIDLDLVREPMVKIPPFSIALDPGVGCCRWPEIIRSMYFS